MIYHYLDLLKFDVLLACMLRSVECAPFFKLVRQNRNFQFDFSWSLQKLNKCTLVKYHCWYLVGVQGVNSIRWYCHWDWSQRRSGKSVLAVVDTCITWSLWVDNLASSVRSVWRSEAWHKPSKCKLRQVATRWDAMPQYCSRLRWHENCRNRKLLNFIFYGVWRRQVLYTMNVSVPHRLSFPREYRLHLSHRKWYAIHKNDWAARRFMQSRRNGLRTLRNLYQKCGVFGKISWWPWSVARIIALIASCSCYNFQQALSGVRGS